MSLWGTPWQPRLRLWILPLEKRLLQLWRMSAVAKYRGNGREKKTPKRPKGQTEGRWLRSRRRLHIDDAEWRYKISSGGIAIWSPDGRKHIVPMNVFTGWSWDNIERAHYKGYWLELGPSEVKAYIEKYDLFGPDCPGTGEEVIPPIVPGTEDSVLRRRRFLPEQHICSGCGERVQVIGWRRVKHPLLRAG